MKSFIIYCINPQHLRLNKNVDFITFIKFILIYFILIIVPAGITTLLESASVIPGNVLLNLKLDWIDILKIIILVPFLEEVFFRLNLRLNIFYIGVFFSVIIYLMTRTLKDQWTLYLASSILLFFYYIIYKNREVILCRLHHFWKKYFKYLFHISSLSFAFFHLFNFETINYQLIILSPLVLFPQIVMGYLLGYVRMNYGFKYNFLLHGAINLIAISPETLELLN